jgi:hypothetical protein
MEIDGKYIFYGVIVFMVMSYIIYYLFEQNCLLKGGEKKDETKDEKTITKLVTKGAKAYACSNNLEEIPKFL